jgi:hypothetical protein
MTLFLDSVVSVLLIATIIYAIRLSRKIDHLRAGKKELLSLVHYFEKATNKAEQNIAELKSLSSQAGTHLQKSLKKADSSIADLEYMIGRAQDIGQTLSSNIAQSLLGAPSQPKRLEYHPAANTNRAEADDVVTLGSYNRLGQTRGATPPTYRPSFSELSDDEILGNSKPLRARKSTLPKEVEVSAALSRKSRQGKQDAIESLMERIARHRDAQERTVTPRIAPSSSRNPQVHNDIMDALKAVREGQLV